MAAARRRSSAPTCRSPRSWTEVEVRGDVTTSQTRRLIESAVGTYDDGKTFYRDAAEAAADLELRQPEDGETVVLLVADRHDNIGMDRVARAVGDAAGAEAVFDAGDDTSTGSTWEAFSLDSLDAAFDDGPYADSKWAVTGNHDHGSFVGDYLVRPRLDRARRRGGRRPGRDPAARRRRPALQRARQLARRERAQLRRGRPTGWRTPPATPTTTATGSRTILVHDANMGDEALERGCADLVIGGHLHVQSGPTEVTGENGAVGYSYTTGTTGGAAYAIAVGAAIRRPAGITLLTYRDGHPVGVQPVTARHHRRLHGRRLRGARPLRGLSAVRKPQLGDRASPLPAGAR